MEIQNHGRVCGDCGRVFAAGDAVYTLRSGRVVCYACKRRRMARTARARAMRAAYADLDSRRIRGYVTAADYEIYGLNS